MSLTFPVNPIQNCKTGRSFRGSAEGKGARSRRSAKEKEKPASKSRGQKSGVRSSGHQHLHQRHRSALSCHYRIGKMHSRLQICALQPIALYNDQGNLDNQSAKVSGKM